MEGNSNQAEIINIPRIRAEHMDTVYFYSNVRSGYHYIEDNAFIPETIMKGDQNYLLALYSGDRVVPEDRGKIINLYERIQQGMREPIRMSELSTELRIREQEDETILLSIRCYLDLDEKGLIRAYVGKVKRLQGKELEDREILTSFTDDKNPGIFINRISRFQAKAPERQYAYIQFDIRKFRYINSTYGSDRGDEVLQYILDTLKMMCDDDHIYCRLSSDLFQVVTYYNSREEILEFIENLDERLHRCGNIRFQMSYGVSVVPGTGTEYRRYGDEAGIARMYIKNSVLRNVAFYDETLDNSQTAAALIEEAEEEALRNGEFRVYLQPKYSYDKHKAKIVGAEALVRWIASDNKVKSPAEFIPVFEKNGFILKLDQYMWENVCILLHRWLQEGKEPVPISVNVSRTYLGKIDVVSYLKRLVEKYELPIGLLQVEITETAENEATIEYANAFKEAGFTLMMDDFGSGLSSLSMLKDTPFDVLKMDRLFLDECLENEHGKTIVSHVISMSGDLGLDIIAEGVETKEQADFLYDNGCQTSQGFYFSKPVPIEEFERLWSEDQQR